jgi:hypothetical protein
MLRNVLLLSVLLVATALRAAPGPLVPAGSVAAAGPVTLTGANGRGVDFAGIWEARPEGLMVVMTADSPLLLVPWDRFDLAKLKSDQPAIWAAHERAVFLKSAQPVNQGLFRGVLSVAQVGGELRRILETTTTLKVPVVYRTKTETTTEGQTFPVNVLNVLTAQSMLNQHTVTETETRQVGPDAITTSLRRVLELLVRTDGVLQSDRRAIFELCKGNPGLLEDAARQLELVRAQLPPVRLLANDPTLQTLGPRLTEAVEALRSVTSGLTVERAQQEKLTAFLALADHPLLQ